MGAGATPAAAPRVVINHTASKIYQYDPSPSGDGTVTQPATNARATFYNCPAGDYQLNATLRQNGTNMAWATSGRGAGEFSCDGTTKRISINWPFTGKSLHAGSAYAVFALNKVASATTASAPPRTLPPCVPGTSYTFLAVADLRAQHTNESPGLYLSPGDSCFA